VEATEHGDEFRSDEVDSALLELECTSQVEVEFTSLRKVHHQVEFMCRLEGILEVNCEWVGYML
jgi:hypothetical protein